MSLYFSRLDVFFEVSAMLHAMPQPLLHDRGGDVIAFGEGEAEVYVVATGSFTAHASISPSCPARDARLAALRNGDALLVGGWRSDSRPAATACAYRRALDSVVELRTQAGQLRLDLLGHSLTALGQGKVLLVGSQLADGQSTGSSKAAWLYDDTQGTWTRLGESLEQARSDHAAVATSSTDAGALVMVIGGRAGDGSVLDTIEVFNPESGQFSKHPGRLATPRARPSATYVPGQQVVVVAGGMGADGIALDTVEVVGLYSVVPVAESMSVGGTPPDQTGREGHSALLLQDGTVLVSGGRNAAGAALSSALRFDPVSSRLSFFDAGGMRHARADHAMALLCDGTVLVVGGSDDSEPVAMAELYNPTD